MAQRAQRPFWIHQLIEYIIGISLVMFGFQEAEPLVPALCGLLVMLNASLVSGPLAAFRAVNKPLHRWIDIAIIAVLAGAAVQPWLVVSAVGRAALLGICVPYGFMWFYTDWADRGGRAARRAAQAGSTGDSIGRAAGRLAGRGWRSAKRSSDKG